MCQELRSTLSAFDPFLTAMLFAILTKIAYFHPKSKSFYKENSIFESLPLIM